MSSQVVVSRSKQQAPPGKNHHGDDLGSAELQRQDEEDDSKTKAVGTPDTATNLGLAAMFVALVVLFYHDMPVFEAADPQPILKLVKMPDRTIGEITDYTNLNDIILECKASPWKPDENLVGSCQGSLNHYETVKARSVYMDVRVCALECCSREDCVAWQFREDVGCLHGGDVRLGMEKDGPGSWCHDHPPMRWQGQYLSKPENEKKAGIPKKDPDACHIDTWNPDEQPGQCFGLGDKRKGIESAEACMQACCGDPDCFAWQFQPELGCFYNKGMHGCTKIDDPVVLQPFVGRRKKRSDRSYTDKHDKPWQQTLGASTMKPKQRLR